MRDDAQSGAQNMATDEALLLQMKAGDAPILRFYNWQPACVSIGRFQKTETLPQLTGEIGRDWVRRPTGGRAVLHQHEITYAVVLREEMLLSNERSVALSYRRISEGFLAGLQLLGISAQIAESKTLNSQAKIANLQCVIPSAVEESLSVTISQDSSAALEMTRTSIDAKVSTEKARDYANQSSTRWKDVAPNCFQSATRADFVVDGRKILGAAQCRKEGAILQHGSLLIDMDEGAWRSRVGGEMRNVVTLKSLHAEKSRDEIVAALIEGCVQSWKSDFAMGSLNTDELQLAKLLCAQKYESASWNERAAKPLECDV